jgi:hypothetical protein
VLDAAGGSVGGTSSGAGGVGDDGVLGEQREEPGISDGGRREDGRDAVQALELLGPTGFAAGGIRPEAGALVPQQQGDRLELHAHGGRHPTALGGRFDLTDRSGEHRDDVVGVADPSLVPRGGTPSAGPALAWSGHELLLRVPGTVATAACRPVRGKIADRARRRPGRTAWRS